MICLIFVFAHMQQFQNSALSNFPSMFCFVLLVEDIFLVACIPTYFFFLWLLKKNLLCFLDHFWDSFPSPLVVGSQSFLI
jgi:hypothetical protein